MSVITDKEINILNKMDPEKVKASLYYKDNVTKFDTKYFKDLDLPPLILEIFEDSFYDMELDESQEYIFREKDIQFQVFNKKGWKLTYENGNRWFDEVLGIWTLHINNEMCKYLEKEDLDTEPVFEIVMSMLGTAWFRDQLEVPDEICDFILSLTKEDLQKTNNGNGIFIKFSVLEEVEAVGSSEFKW